MKKVLRPFFILVSSSVRSINNGLRLIFNILYLITKPNLLLIRIIQFIKSKPFAILLLLAASWFVMDGTMKTAPILLRKMFPEWSDEIILANAKRLAIFSETALIILKLQKKKFWAFITMILVIAFALGGLFYDAIINIENYTIFQLVGIALIQGAPTLISVILLWSSGNDASKVAKYTKFDQSFTGKKKKRNSLSTEERDKLNKEILEHVDHHFKTDKENLSFNSVKEAFPGRVHSSETVNRLLKKERPIIFAHIKDAQKSGRKPEKKKENVKINFSLPNPFKYFTKKERISQ